MIDQPDPLTAAARAEVARVYGDTVPEWHTQKAYEKQLQRVLAEEAGRDFAQFDTEGWRRRRRSRERDLEDKDDTGEG